MSGGRGTTVLVSGGAGYVGSHAAAALAGAGYRPVVIDDLSGGCREAVPVGVEFIQGDAGDRDAVEAVVAKRRIRAAVHLAGAPGVDGPADTAWRDAETSRAFAEACAAGGVQRLVLTSSAAVHGAGAGPISAYGAAKRAAEEAVRTALAGPDRSAAVLRCFNLAGADPEGRAGPGTGLVAAACGAALGRRPDITVFGTDWETALVALRAARRLEDPRERALAAFAGAALAGWFVQGLTSFYSAESWLQHMLLLAFLVHVEARMRAGPDPEEPRQPPVALRLAAALRLPPLPGLAGLRAAAGAAALCLAGASIASSAAIHAGAAAMWRADRGGPFIAEIESAIAAFGPLATGPRIVLFNNLALNWQVLAEHETQEAARLLALADGEAEAALAAEPESWVLHHALARLYLKVAATRPDYAARAQGHLERSRVLAPNLDPMEAPLPPAAAHRGTR